MTRRIQESVTMTRRMPPSATANLSIRRYSVFTEAAAELQYLPRYHSDHPFGLLVPPVGGVEAKALGRGVLPPAAHGPVAYQCEGA